VNLDQLRKVCPACPVGELERQLPHMTAAMALFGVNTALRKAAFIAQWAHETNELRQFVEADHHKVFSWCSYCQKTKAPHPAGVQYEGRKGLGNTQPGDGERYKGRGVCQLTGRANYRRYGQKLDLPLEIQPELAARPDVAWTVAGAYWQDHGCNELADRAGSDLPPPNNGSFDAITKAINGGLNGKPHRDAYYTTALRVLEVS
jgi:predicted chitinase